MRLAALCLAAMLLSACGDCTFDEGCPDSPNGGGGGGSTTGGTPQTPQSSLIHGIYGGTRTDDSGSAEVLALAKGGEALVLNLSTGNVDDMFPDYNGAEISGSTFLLPVLRRSLPQGDTIDGGDIAGNSSGTRVNATLIYDSYPPATLSLSRSGQTDFPASTAAISGAYGGSLVGASDVSFAIDGDGNLVGSDGEGCVWSGIIFPADRLTNLYEISLDHQCPEGDGFLFGLAYGQYASDGHASALVLIAGDSRGYVSGVVSAQ